MFGLHQNANAAAAPVASSGAVADAPASVRSNHHRIARSVASAVFLEHRPIAILHLDGRVRQHHGFHPAVERYLGGWKRELHLAPSRQCGSKVPHQCLQHPELR
jgi:hypothetical protein